MFPPILCGRSVRYWHLSHFLSVFKRVKLNSLCDADVSSSRKYEKPLTSPKWWKVYFFRKALKKISWYAVYVSPVMLGNASNFAEVYTLLWLTVFTLLYLAWETLPAILKKVVNLITAKALSHHLFKSLY